MLYLNSKVYCIYQKQLMKASRIKYHILYNISSSIGHTTFETSRDARPADAYLFVPHKNHEGVSRPVPNQIIAAVQFL